MTKYKHIYFIINDLQYFKTRNCSQNITYKFNVGKKSIQNFF